MIPIERPGTARPAEPFGVANHRAHVPNIHPVSALPATSFRAMAGSLISECSVPRMVSATTVRILKFFRSASALGTDAGTKILLTSHSSIERITRAGFSNVLATTEHPYHKAGYNIPSDAAGVDQSAAVQNTASDLL